MKLFTCALAAAAIGLATAACPNGCSGNGVCNEFDECTCYDEGKSTYFGYLYDTTKGYNRIKQDAIRAARLAQGGSSTYGYTETLREDQDRKFFAKDAYIQKQFTGADCSQLTCPRGVSWTANFKQDYTAPGETARTDTTAPSHSACRHADFVECSDAGVCDRSSGACQCFEGYEGSACQRTSCLNECSGHGQCQSNIEFSRDGSLKRSTVAGSTGSDAAEGFWDNIENTKQVDPRKHYIGAWDSGIHFGCKCDIGYRGDDCSLVECPSTADPLGWYGNSDGEDCSGRGLCDYSSGECSCFTGFTGTDCGTVEALA